MLDIGQMIGDVTSSWVSSREAGLNRDSNREEAQKNRDFQERMRSTQYQTQMQDLKAAGINPILGLSDGGAGNLTGSTASSSAMPNIKGGENMNFRQIAENIRLTKVNSAKVEAETGVAQAQQTNLAYDTALKSIQTNQIQKNIGLIEQQIELAKKDNDWYKATKLTNMITQGLGAITGGIFGTSALKNAFNPEVKYVR